MDTVSSLRLGGFNSAAAPREAAHHFRPPPTHTTASTTLLPPYYYPHLPNKPKAPPRSQKPFDAVTAGPLRPSSPLVNPSRRTHRPKPTAVVHQRASTGYAAALLDAARCNNAVDAVERDVRRFTRRFRSVLGGTLVAGEVEKAEVVKGVVEEGGFCEHLAALVKMLVGKGKVGMVGEVMEEFERIYDELSGTRVVLISSEQRMREEQVVEIARRVQRMSGAAKVKVRNTYGYGL